MERFKETVTRCNEITGARVMEVCNLSPGPKVGLVLSKIRDWIADTGETNQEKITKRLIELSKSC